MSLSFDLDWSKVTASPICHTAFTSEVCWDFYIEEHTQWMRKQPHPSWYCNHQWFVRLSETKTSLHGTHEYLVILINSTDTNAYRTRRNYQVHTFQFSQWEMIFNSVCAARESSACLLWIQSKLWTHWLMSLLGWKGLEIFPTCPICHWLH